MAMNPYVIILAGTPSEASRYVREAGLPRGRWRIATQASTIRGLRRAHVHVLPSFATRRDRHAVLTELRYARCDWFWATRDLNDNWTLADQAPTEVKDEPDYFFDLQESAVIANLEKQNSLLEQMADLGVDEKVVQDKIDHNNTGIAAIVEPAVEEVEHDKSDDEAPVRRRKSQCRICSMKHLKGEPCPVQTAPLEFD